MILSTHGIIGSQIVQISFDTDYQAVLNYATTQGYTLPSASQQTLQNQLVIDLKTAGIWSKLDSFAVFATDGDEDFALIDWKRLTDYTAVDSPTHTSNLGFNGDGLAAYINTNFIPSTDGVNFQDSDASFGVYCSIRGVSSTAYLSAFRTSTNFEENFIKEDGAINSINSTSTTNRKAYNSLYTFSQIQITGGNQYLYGNGAQDRVDAVSGTPSRCSKFVPILAFNNAGNIISFSSSTVNFYYLGASLLSESSSFYTILDNYYTSL